MRYEDQYYILMEPDFEYYPQLTPTEKTAARDYHFDPLPPLSDPLFFQNSDVIDHPELKTKYKIYQFWWPI